MLLMKAANKKIATSNCIRRQIVNKKYHATSHNFKNLDNSIKDGNEISRLEIHINPVGIPLLHRSLEKTLFESSKIGKNVNLQPAYEHLSAFNIKVDDVENGKMHSFTIHTRGVITFSTPMVVTNYVSIFRQLE